MYNLNKNGVLEAIIDDNYLDSEFDADDYLDSDIERVLVGPTQNPI